MVVVRKQNDLLAYMNILIFFAKNMDTFTEMLLPPSPDAVKKYH